MQDGWNPRAAARESAFPAAPALPSLRSVAPASSGSVAVPAAETTTGAAIPAAIQPRFQAAEAFPHHPAPFQNEFRHRLPQREELQPYPQGHARHPVYQAHPAGATGAYERIFIKQEAAHEAPRAGYSPAPHVFAQSQPPPASPALPKLSHMLRASSLTDVLNPRQSWTQEPEPEPEYARRRTSLRAPADPQETKNSIGFILGGQDHATYAPTAASATQTVATSSNAAYLDRFALQQTAPPPSTAHSSPMTYWRHDGFEASPYAPSALPPHALVAAGRASSAPALSTMSLQRKIETARPASRTCKFEGCEQYVVDHGLCVRHGGGKRCLTEGCTSRAKHFGRCWRHGGSIECKVDGCINRAKSRGYCWSHGGGTKCKARPCEKIAISNGLCWAHGGGKRCVVSGCRKQAYERTRNFCNSHFQLFKKGLLPPSAMPLEATQVAEEHARSTGL